jgi:hypothetical protein
LKAPIEVLNEAAREKFWGSVQFDFRDGEVTLIRKTETIKVQGTENTRPNDKYARNQ